MKRILLGVALLTITAGAATAQTAKPTLTPGTTQKVDPKLAFSSKINEFDAYSSRNSPELAQKALMELMGTMQERIAVNQTAAPEKAAKGNQLYAEIKKVAPTAIANRAVIVEKLRDFLQIF